MPTRKNEKSEPLRTIKVRADEIFVVKNRSAEPYIRSFVAAPENITQESLGTLVGVFSVSDRSESSGFVVNALISSVRKEYFANPRRGAIESFEASLHRMNITLSELVKNGQTEWIGELHGAVAAIEKHSLHFSVTGSGRILLFRSETLSDIGDGLASEEASVHPMKTFVEISSGRINSGDCVMLASPEVFDLFSDSELERSSRRLLPERKFFRFLETAMTNELRQGAAIILSAEELIEAAPAPARAEGGAKRRSKKTQNLFSADAFNQAAEERASIFQEELPVITTPTEPSAKTTARTGEIYVRGEEPDNQAEHPTMTKLRWIVEDGFTALHNLKQHLRERIRQRREAAAVAISGGLSSSLSKTKRFITRTPKLHQGKTDTLRKEPPRLSQEEPTEMPPEEEQPPTLKRTPRWTIPKITVPKITFPVARVPSIQKISIPALPTDRVGAFVSKIVFDAIIPAARTAIRYGGTIVKALFALTARTFVFLKKRFFALPPKKQLIIASIIAFSITLGGIFSWSTFVHEPPTEVPIIVADAPEETLPPTGEHNAILASPEMIAETAENIIAPIFLKDALYLVMENGIYDAEKREVFPLSSETPIRYASGMDDLNLVFLMTAEGRLFAFAPSNHSLVENVLRLPAGFRPAGIGTFLTYLYVLEEGTGKIYRFPRAEGGFGDGMLWTKTTFDTETSAIAVSENIYGMTASGIQSFFRGNVTESFSQEMPAKALSPESICASEESPEQFAVVDSRSKRVVLYGTDGHIVSQYFHESFSEASACALSGDGSSVAVGIGKQTSIIRLTNTTGQ